MNRGPLLNNVTHFAAVILTGLLLAAAPAWSVEMMNDPDGYNGLRWGTTLAKASELTLVKSTDRTAEFSPKDGVPLFGEAKVDSMTFIAIDEQFARVIVRYKGVATHTQVLGHLQKVYGPLDRSPGSMVRGLNQQFDWRGENTEVNVLYESVRDRGFIFIESRILASKFNEGLSETAY